MERRLHRSLGGKLAPLPCDADLCKLLQNSHVISMPRVAGQQQLTLDTVIALDDNKIWPVVLVREVRVSSLFC